MRQHHYYHPVNIVNTGYQLSSAAEEYALDEAEAFELNRRVDAAAANFCPSWYEEADLPPLSQLVNPNR